MPLRMRLAAVDDSRGRRRVWAPLLALACLGLSLSCSNVRYVAQSLSGGAQVLLERKSIERVLERGGLDPETERKLRLVQDLRLFAQDALELPVDRAYATYVDLDRDFVTWNVVATPALSIQPEVWCFPIAGCVSYRGYFKEKRALRFADRLSDQGMDVTVGGVTAYSTLGWFADPVLSTFLRSSDLSLAGLLFHELAHRRFYLPGDTAFNESFASAVELVGERLWLEHLVAQDTLPVADAEALSREADELRDREATFVAMILETQRCLADLYGSTQSDAAKTQGKAREFDALKRRYAQVRAAWLERDPGAPVYDGWFARELNNAHVASVGDYSIWLEAFLELERQSAGFGDFYARVERLAALPRSEREQALRALNASSVLIEERSVCASVADHAIDKAPGEAGKIGEQSVDPEI